MTRRGTIEDALRAAFPPELARPYPEDHYYTGGHWAAPCMCGHPEADHPGGWESCDHTDDTCLLAPGQDYCGGFDPQPAMALPRVRHEGMSPFLRMLRGLPK